MYKHLALVTILITMLSGCSSIISKSDYAISINSTPDEAKFVVTNKAGQKVHGGTTPSTVTLKSSSGFFSGETYTISFTKNGYTTKMHTITSDIDGWYFGNILFGGLIGMLIVDPATGAMYNLPDRIEVSLDSNVSSTKPESLTISTIDSLTAEDISRLQKIK